MRGKSRMSSRNTPQRMTCGRSDPAACSIVRRFFRHCSVCVSMSGPASEPVAGSVAPCPDTNTSRSNKMPGEYGPTGFGRLAATIGRGLLMPQSVTDVVPADRQNRPADRRTGRIGRLTWMFASFIAVQAVVCAVAALPFVLLARELVVATVDGWLRWAIAAAAAVPAYALFAMTLMVCSAVANRMAGWRTP